MIVADTNILVYLLVPGDATAQAESAYRRDAAWAAPALWRSEFRNALALYIRRRMLTLEETLTTVEKAESIMQPHTYNVESLKVLKLAASSGCSPYDCEFVALAQELGVPLVTSDRRLAGKFKPIAIHLRDFVLSARP